MIIAILEARYLLHIVELCWSPLYSLTIYHNELESIPMSKKPRAAAILAATAASMLAFSAVASAHPGHHSHFTTTDTSNLPVVYLSGANDISFLNSDIKENIVNAGMQFFEWDPLATSIKGEPKLYDHMDGYANSVDAFVKDVLKQTGAKKVNIITYSQSGLINQNWMRNHGGAQYVAKVINYSGLLQGSPLATIATNLTGDCLGFGTCLDFNPYGFVAELNKNGEAVPGVTYYNLTSRYDEMAMPYQINFMYAPTGNYKNVLLQDYCPADRSGHLGLPHAAGTMSITIQALKGQPLKPKC